MEVQVLVHARGTARKYGKKYSKILCEEARKVSVVKHSHLNKINKLINNDQKSTVNCRNASILPTSIY